MNSAVIPLAEWAPLLLTQDEPTKIGDLSRPVHQVAAGPHDLLEQPARDRRLGHDTLAAGVQHGDLRALLVGGEVRLEEELAYLGAVLDDPRAGGRGGFAGEVLACRVAGRVVEAAEHDPAGRVLLDVAQPPGSRRRFGGLLDLVEVLDQPLPEGPGLP